MAEELVIDKPTVTTDSFDGSEKPLEEKAAEPIVAVKVDEQIKKVDEPIIKDIEVPKDWLKKEFDIEDPAILKAEIQELKNIKANPPKAEEIKFKDEQSQHIHELLREGKPENKKAVREFLQTQEQIDELSGIAEVNKDNAEDIIKLQIKLANKTLSTKEIEFEYKQLYTPTKEPVQKATEDDDDFKERHDDWEEQVSMIEMRRIVAAKKAQPELSKLKTELELPEITKIEPTQKQLTPDELAIVKQEQEKFLQNADAALKAFEGFNVNYKGNDVEVESNYALSDDEKTSVLGKMKLLAENGYDANAIFAEKWINTDGSFNFNQMAKDIATLETDDKRSQKYVSDTVAKAKLGFIKEKHNIDLVVDSKGELQLEDKDAQKKNEDAIWT